MARCREELAGLRSGAGEDLWREWGLGGVDELHGVWHIGLGLLTARLQQQRGIYVTTYLRTCTVYLLHILVQCICSCMYTMRDAFVY